MDNEERIKILEEELKERQQVKHQSSKQSSKHQHHEHKI